MENKPIRVLQMIGSLYPGGSQTMIMNVYKNIDRSKIQFDFIIDHPEYDFYKSTIEELGGKIYVMPSFKGYNLLEIVKSWNTFFDNHPEYKVLHSHSRSYASIYLPIAKKYGLKTIIHSHSISNGKNIKSVFKYLMQLPLRYQADYFFGCSKEAGLWLFGRKIVNSNRFYIINNAVDLKKFVYNPIVREKYRKDFDVENKMVCIQVGNFVPEKNHIFSVDLISKINEQNDNIKLYLVGDGDQRKNIENEIEKLGLSDYIELLGFRNDVNNLLQMADIYLMPSTFEGLSLAAIEAQASGIKCIFSNMIDVTTKVSEACEFVELDIDEWIKIIKEMPLKRFDTVEDIKKFGFDINTTTDWLTNFYIASFKE